MYCSVLSATVSGMEMIPVQVEADVLSAIVTLSERYITCLLYTSDAADEL